MGSSIEISLRRIEEGSVIDMEKDEIKKIMGNSGRLYNT